MATKIKGSNLTSSTFIIPGDLQVDGTTTTINSTTLTVDDKNLVLASGAVNAAAADGAGLTIDGASATFTYAATGDKFGLNKTLDITGNLTLTSTDAGDEDAPIITLFRNSASPADGDDLGRIDFIGKNDAGQNITYGAIFTEIADASDGTEDARMKFVNIANGSSESTMEVKFGNVAINGQLDITTGGFLRFEGTTADDFEAVLSPGDPTADRTITLPDATGTVITTGNLSGITSTGTLSSLTTSGTVNITGDGNDLVVNSADYELALLGNRGSSGVDLDKAYLRMKAEGTNTIVLDTAGNSYLNGGNVGIGTASPAGLLSLEANNPNIRFDDTNTSNNGEITLDNTALRIEADEDNAVANSLITFRVDGSEKMRIDASGNVGIGTTSVNRGQLQIASAGNVELHLTGSGQTGSGDGMTITANSSEGNIWLRENGYFRIATNGSERMRITSGGSVNIGGTGAQAKFEVNRAVSTAGSLTDTMINLATTGVTGRKANIGFGLAGGVANTNAATIGFDVTNGSGALQGDLFFSTRGSTADSVPTERLRILSGGGITFNGDTAAANALDDYEEGSYTPQISATDGIGTLTYSYRVGRYTKVGNRVMFNAYVKINNKGTVAGLLRITTPFTPANISYNHVAIAHWVNGSENNQAFEGERVTYAYLSPNEPIVRFYSSNGDGGLNHLSAAHVKNGTDFMIQGTFQV